MVRCLLRGVGAEPNDHYKENVFSGNESGKFDIPLPKLKKKISQRDKDIFIKKSFGFIKEYFKAALFKLEDHYQEVETDFTEVHNFKFLCKIYINGDIKNECIIRVGGIISNSISYTEGSFLDVNNDNSFNDWLSIEDDGLTIYFEPFNNRIGYPDAEERIEKSEKAAEYLWKKFTGLLKNQL